MFNGTISEIGKFKIREYLMINNNKSRFTFPVGYHKFHKKQVFNFQLNRWHSFGYAIFEDMKEVGQKIKTFGDWKIEMEQLSPYYWAHKIITFYSFTSLNSSALASFSPRLTEILTDGCERPKSYNFIGCPLTLVILKYKTWKATISWR